VARERAIVAGAFAALAALATVWLAIDRTPPEWDHANHLERVVHCAADMARGDLRRIFERSTFYPPVVPCAAALVYRLAPSDAIGSQAVVLAFLGLGMAAVYLLGRHVAGGTEGVVAAVIFGTAPFVVFSSLRFQLDLPLAALVPDDAHDAEDGRVHARRLVPRGRRTLGPGNADEAHIRGVRIGAACPANGAHQKSRRLDQRGVGGPGRGRRERAVVRPPTLRTPDPDRQPFVQAGGGGRQAGAADYQRTPRLPDVVRSSVRNPGSPSVRGRTRRGPLAATGSDRDRVAGALRPAPAAPEQGPAIHAAAAADRCGPRGLRIRRRPPS